MVRTRDRVMKGLFMWRGILHLFQAISVYVLAKQKLFARQRYFKEKQYHIGIAEVISVSATKSGNYFSSSDLRIGNEVLPICIVFRSPYQQRRLFKNYCFQISVSGQYATISHEVLPICIVFRFQTKSCQMYCFQISDLRFPYRQRNDLRIVYVLPIIIVFR